MVSLLAEIVLESLMEIFWKHHQRWQLERHVCACAHTCLHMHACVNVVHARKLPIMQNSSRKYWSTIDASLESGLNTDWVKVIPCSLQETYTSFSLLKVLKTVDVSFSAVLVVLFQQFDVFWRIKITDALQVFVRKVNEVIFLRLN
jgi:hypothetical protein